MYVALNNSAVVYHDNPDAAFINLWTEWTIDLQTFADQQGVNLANVYSITLGLGNWSNPVAGGTGMMYFDDIRLYRPDPWGSAHGPNLANGTVDVEQTPILNWRSGYFTASHEVYFGTDQDAVKNADTSSQEYKGNRNIGSESYDPGKLEWNTIYYWRIDEVNNANPDSPWKGSIWSFTTADFLVVDDFESYNVLNPDESGSNRIFNAWIDGLDNPAVNGSVVGYQNLPFAERHIVHSGNQSMPFAYDNGVGKSEATLALTDQRDWTVNGVNTLTIWFRGDSTNAPETMYVALNDDAVVYHANPIAVQEAIWTEWNIDLQAFADQGINLANVSEITLGLGNRNNPVADGSGMIFFDDIRLYRPRNTPEE
jgi:hypothetical protein